MYSIVAIVCLAFAFIVLLFTFRWIAKLVARRLIARSQAGEEASEDGPNADSATEDEANQEDEDVPRGAGVIHGANYGLVLGILACILFKLSPLMLILSGVGLFYSGRTLYEGVRYFATVIYRAVAGLVLSLISVGLHYLNLTGQLAELLWRVLPPDV